MSWSKLKYSPLLCAVFFSCAEKSGGEDQINPGNSTVVDYNFAPVVNATGEYHSSLLRKFQQQVNALTAAADSYCRSPDSNVSGLATLKDQWKTTMGVWQQIESNQIGTIIDQAYTLRNDVYSWPLVSKCGVDKELISLRASGDTFVLSRSDNRKGLSALEYLIFAPLDSSACTAQVAEAQAWAALNGTERTQAKCELIQVMVKDVKDVTDSIVERWDNQQAAQWNSTDQSVTNRLTQQAFDSLFYLDLTVKDSKIAGPLAIGKPCSSTTCEHLQEHGDSDYSFEAIYQNLVGFQGAINGGSQENSIQDNGFLGLLKSNGQETLAASMLANIQSAVSFLKGRDASITMTQTAKTSRDCAANPEEFGCQLHGKVKSVTDQLKGEFVQAMGLKAPSRAGGDND